MLFRFYQALLAAQEAVRRTAGRGLDAGARVLGWGASWEAARWLIWRRAVPWLAWAAVLATGAVLADRAALPWLWAWQARRFVAQAERCALAGQPEAAAFRLRKALSLQPQHTGATRLLARLAEEAGSPTALVWYWRLAGQPEATTADRLGLARTALRFERPPFLLASNGLFAIPPTERSNRVYATLLAEYYLKTGRPDLAEAQYTFALGLDPAHQPLHIALHTVRLASTNPLVARAAVQELMPFAADPAHGLSVCRSLREYYLAENDASQALVWAARALARPEAVFQDTLRHLEALRLAAPEKMAGRVRELAPVLGTQPAPLAALLQWLLDTRQPALAWDVWQRLPAESRRHPALRPPAVSIYLQTDRRPELCAWLKEQHWEAEDWRRRLWLIRTLREIGREAEARQAWDELLPAAGERPAWLWETARLTQQWHWREAWPPLLERALPFLCRDTAEVLRWHNLLESQGRTLDLWQLYRQLLDCQTHWLVRNNYAALSLLTGRETNQAHALARQLYLEQPHNEFCAATYALSLHLQGQSTNAVMVLQRLPRRALERPVIMAYHGLLLAATGRKEAALTTLQNAAQAPLLPEERALLNQALEQARALPWTERRPLVSPRKP